MPRMNEQVRKRRAKKLLRLRDKGIPPGEAWSKVKGNSKATEKNPAKLCQREIRWYRERYGVVAAAPAVKDGTSLAVASVEVTGAATVKPATQDNNQSDHSRLEEEKRRAQEAERHRQQEASAALVQAIEARGAKERAEKPRVVGFCPDEYEILQYPDGRRVHRNLRMNTTTPLEPGESLPPGANSADAALFPLRRRY